MIKTINRDYFDLMKSAMVLLLLTSMTISCKEKVGAPQPYGVLPSERQLKWHELETYAFLHFTTNTFTDKEWGYGDESVQVFNPSDFDADQIIGTLAKAGFKGAIITAKHHDGFCLWPSEFTEHSVKNSPWKEGKGDVVKEIAEACRKYDVKFGVYLSPWDRNHADYGNENYTKYYRQQLNELLTNYGDVFQIWFDGANGGDGYYGGANEERKIDRSVYYGWEKNFEIVRELQPDAIMFSDAGPDIRWVGNEHGHAQDSCWATYTPIPNDGYEKAFAGTCKYWLGETGTKDGKYWMPAETDVSIRPGWFYHASEDEKVKSLKELLDIYFHSVGNGTSLNLNVPPDRTGQIHEIDSLRLMEFKAYLDDAFSDNLLKNASVNASDERGDDYEAENLIDGNKNNYWAASDGLKSAVLEFELDKERSFNCLVMQEYIQLGQRGLAYSVEVFENGHWIKIAEGSTIGYKKIVRFDKQESKKFRIQLDMADVPVLSSVELYNINDILLEENLASE